MMWDEWNEDYPQQQPDQDQDSYLNFDFISLLAKPKDYYKILEVDYDAPEDVIRSNYIRLALQWHPDKKKGNDDTTSRFQEINEAYQAVTCEVKVDDIIHRFSYGEYVLSDPVRRSEYDTKGMMHVYDYNIIDYLNRYKGLILTCNGLGIKQSIW